MFQTVDKVLKKGSATIILTSTSKFLGSMTVIVTASAAFVHNFQRF